jgi:hypothetical protein
MRTLTALLLLSAPAFADGITATKSKDAVEFKDGDQLVTRYHIGEAVAKPYFWPVNAPGEIPVTRPWPMVKGTPGETTDHVHQKSAWFCHGDVIPDGVELKTRSADTHVKGVDFWSEAKGHGKMACVEVGEPKAGEKGVSVPTKNEWRTPDGVNILDEARTITVSKTAHGYLIALDIDLHASVCPITFGDTKEGSMGVRVPDAFRTQLKDGGTITSADGKAVPPGTKGTLSVWGQPADWHDYSGTVGDKPAGVAVFADAKNPHPSAWHTRDYGLMAANPFGRGKSGYPSQKGKTDLVTLKKGEHLKLRYAVYAHTGDAKSGGVAEAYKAFSGK